MGESPTQRVNVRRILDFDTLGMTLVTKFVQCVKAVYIVYYLRSRLSKQWHQVKVLFS